MLSRLFLRRAGLVIVVASLPLAVAAEAPTVGVKWRTNLDAARLEAAQTGRFVLLHFTTRTCGPCKVLDQNVFSQPQVAAAIEQDYVPVRIDADEMQALARSYRIDRVPTEVIVSPDGNPLNSPAIPDQPDAYVSQLQNLARHFRQAANQSAPQGAPAPGVNSAYAGLPVSAPQTAPMVPQAQGNPYVKAATAPQTYGQAQSIYAAPGQPNQTAAPQGGFAQEQAAMSSQAPPSTTFNPAAAAQQATTPSNAMPRSYRDPSAAAAPAAMAPPTAPSAAMTPPASFQNTPAAAVPADAAAVSAAAQVAVAAAPKPQAPKPPAGSPPMAFEGCCPVTLKTMKKWTYGDVQFGAVHRGRTYLFAGAQQRDQFLAAPDAYSPVFAGMDPVLLIDQQQSVEGDRKFGYEYGGSFYLFASKETMLKFASSPHTYAAGVRQAMSRIDAAGDGVIRR